MNLRVFAAPALLLVVVACARSTHRASPASTPLPSVAARAIPTPTRATSPVADAEGVYSVGGPVTEPVELLRVPPEIPQRFRHIAGSPPLFIYEAVITRDGSIASLRLLRGPTTTEQNLAFDHAYRTSIAQQRYRPATLHGTPVPVRITITAFPGVR